MSRLDDEWPAHRPAVFGAAYRITGSVADAEDIVQDVWIRAHSRDSRRNGEAPQDGDSLDGVHDLRAWLITVAARRAYDVLGSARARRVDYVGPWLPEPLLTGPDAAEPVLMDETAGTAMLLVMEELTPPERVAFVLHQAFDVPYEQIADVLGKTPAACRQLASRARRKIAAALPHRPVPAAEREKVLAAFRSAYERRDEAALLELLDPDAAYTTDGGGRVFAARKIIAGAGRVVTALLRVSARTEMRIVPAQINGRLEFLVYRDDHLAAVDTVEVENSRITAYRRVLNPLKLERLTKTLP
ncbi:sigma-70 family RNA polymerase sigma factor [Actinomadura sp. KC06]|uniref:sigma-70 family RNA polymerase sigma factor n=1 Tax=Actinomadura sp. KC06 TaxID=2530369 RepID=UPI001046088B|nr:sigma-70 family RNA polymerase sigma factor [Actinomadura sp. KC06]TDD23963.1 sigma-70 family RNA polymerase sigma factor [Actinomadura sp. KC06]